ncbi:MAG: radical SAM protein [Thermacetogeniaceae bacterium]
METRNRSDWIDQIVKFIGEYTGNNPGYSPRVVAEIMSNKFLISVGEAEKLLSYLNKESAMNRLCLTAMELNLTFNCNLACDYCFVRRKNIHDRMNFATAQRAIDLLLEQAVAPNVVITLIGGEPLLEMELIKKIVPYAIEAARTRNLQVTWAITTNGTLINEDTLKFFAQYKINMLLSMDGGPENHDRHRRTKSGEGTWHHIASRIPLIKKYQPWLSGRMTVSTEALDTMREDFRRLVDLGFNTLLISPAQGARPWSKKQIEHYGLNFLAILHDYHQLKQRGVPIFIEEFETDERYTGWGCRAGRSSLAVAPNGEISPCSKLLGLDDETGRHIVGNINQEINVRLLQPFQNPICQQPEDCKHCFMKCSGYCYAVNFEQTGNHFVSSEEHCLFWAAKHEIKSIAKTMV